MLHQVKELPNDSGRPLSHNNFTNNNKMAATKNQCFIYDFGIEPSLNLPSFKVRGLQMIIHFALV